MSSLWVVLWVCAAQGLASAQPTCTSHGEADSPIDQRIQEKQEEEVDHFSTLQLQGSFGPLKVCTNAPYTLCATSTCTVMNSLAVCNCTYMGVNASATAAYQNDNGAQWTNAAVTDVCDWMSQLSKVGKVLSTYSGYMTIDLYNYPKRLSPNQVSYDICLGDSTTYAQCDGGVCEVMDEVTLMPKLDPDTWKVGDLSVCSCPISTGKAQIAGIHTVNPTTGKCEKKINPYCKPKTTALGTYKVKIGAPPGISKVLDALIEKKTGYAATSDSTCVVY